MPPTRSNVALRRAFLPSIPCTVFRPHPRWEASAFSESLLNDSLLKMAMCAPPRHAGMRRYSEVYITELGAKARNAARALECKVAAS